jgi:hypothetical protein
MTADPCEIQRTRPDYVIHDPTGGRERPWDDGEFYWLNEHILVHPLGDSSLLATWTAERLDAPCLMRIGVRRSTDGGDSWSPLVWADGRGVGGDGQAAAWQVPLESPGGRVYLLYTLCMPSVGFTGGLYCRYSDDRGSSWSQRYALKFPPSAIDGPDPEREPVRWIGCSGMHRTAAGKILIPFTHWACNPGVPAGTAPFKERYSHIELMRVENLHDSPLPDRLEFSWLNRDAPVTAPHESVAGASFAQEPYLVNLPDGRLFMTIRTNRGEVWYAVSSDQGRTWGDARPMRMRDGGPKLRHPSSPCPIFGLGDGRFLFLFHDNDGYVFGADNRWHVRNRRPTYACVGEARPGAEQPIWWGGKRLLIDNDAVPWGPPGRERFESAAYVSMTCVAGRRVLWYPDRKGFLLGKRLDDEQLAGRGE